VLVRPDRFRIDLAEPRKESYLCDGKSFYEVKERTRQIVEHPIPPERRGKLLDRPPVNFLVGGPAAEALRLYRITWVGEDAATVTVELVPKPEYKDCDFTKARVTFDKKLSLPVRVHRWLRKKKQTEETHEFRNTQINPDVDPAEFMRPKLPAGWTWEKPPAVRRAPEPAGPEVGLKPFLPKPLPDRDLILLDLKRGRVTESARAVAPSTRA